MKVKAGVDLTNMSPKAIQVVALAAPLWTALGEEIVVTSGREGNHMKGSKHYLGEAIDFRTRYFPDSVKRALAVCLQHRLGDAYDVVVESTHIHVEYDPD